MEHRVLYPGSMKHLSKPTRKPLTLALIAFLGFTATGCDDLSIMLSADDRPVDYDESALPEPSGPRYSYCQKSHYMRVVVDQVEAVIDELLERASARELTMQYHGTLMAALHERLQEVLPQDFQILVAKELGRGCLASDSDSDDCIRTGGVDATAYLLWARNQLNSLANNPPSNSNRVCVPGPVFEKAEFGKTRIVDSDCATRVPGGNQPGFRDAALEVMVSFADLHSLMGEIGDSRKTWGAITRDHDKLLRRLKNARAQIQYLKSHAGGLYVSLACKFTEAYSFLNSPRENGRGRLEEALSKDPLPAEALATGAGSPGRSAEAAI